MNDDDNPQTLAELVDRLVELVDALDDIEARVTEHRHATMDAAQTLSLHAVADYVNLAWGHARMGLTGLTEHVSVYPDAR